MSRALKFRVWHEMCHNFGYFKLEDGSHLHIHGKPEQFTGLLDRNGKEIYEGDIFRNAINGGTWRVGWDKKGAAFWVDSGVAGCNLGEFNLDRSNGKYGFIRKNCEVIGNIHESPELVGGKE